MLGPDVPAVSRAVNQSAPEEPISVREAFCRFLTKQLEEENLRVDERAMFALAQMYDDFPTLVNLKNVAAHTQARSTIYLRNVLSAWS